jgi:hypothetical protein
MATRFKSSTTVDEPDDKLNGWSRIWHHLNVRLLLVLGVVVLAIAVSLDSFQEAAAADMQTASPAALIHPNSHALHSSRSSKDSVFSDKTYLEFDSSRAKRLGFSDLVRANITRSRLTRAHLFTTLVR